MGYPGFIWLAILVVSTLSAPALAQSEAPYEQSVDDEIMFRAEVAEDGVRLLWMPLRQNSFYASLSSGFVLERYAEDEAPGPGVSPEWTRAVSLASPAVWQTFPDEDLYEELYDFASDSTGTPVATSPGDQGYAFAMMDMGTNYLATRLAGFAYIDSSVQRERRYTYVLRRAGTLQASTVALARLAIATDTITRYPGPWIDTVFREKSKVVKVAWDRAETDASYDAYFVERAELNESDTPGPWEQVNAAPLLQLYTEGFVDTLMYYTDTTADNNLDYAYRVQGLTAFGHYGTPSDTVILRAAPDPLLDRPAITLMTRVIDTLFRVAWTPGEADSSATTLREDLVEWRVYTSEDAYDDLRLVGDSSLAPGTRDVILVDPPDGTYVTVEAVDRNGTVSTSHPKLLRALDKRPPAAPTGLTGSIDTSGAVTLNWAANPEVDVLGYRVFRSNRDTGYFPQLTPDATPFVNWADSVSMQMASEEVYYRIAAEDYAGNQSAYSAVLTVKRPDILPPVAPAIRDFAGSTKSVTFEVALSSSPDVVDQLFQRRLTGGVDTIWRLVTIVTDTAEVVSVSDSTGAPGVDYDYRVLAVDDAQLSTPSRTYTASRTKDPRRAPVEGFNVELLPGTEQPTLSWKYPAAPYLRGFQVYRVELEAAQVLDTDPEAIEFKALTLLTPNDKDLRLRAGRFYFVDRTVSAGQRYAYRIYARHRGGGYSELTEAIVVATP